LSASCRSREDRLDRAQDSGRELDRFERESSAFFVRVRNAYLERAAADPERYRIVDSTRTQAEVRAELGQYLSEAMGSA